MTSIWCQYTVRVTSGCLCKHTIHPRSISFYYYCLLFVVLLEGYTLAWIPLFVSQVPQHKFSPSFDRTMQEDSVRISLFQIDRAERAIFQHGRGWGRYNGHFAPLDWNERPAIIVRVG